MSNNAVTEPKGKWQPAAEQAPSVLRSDDFLAARLFGLGSLFVFVLGVMGIILSKPVLGLVLPAFWGALATRSNIFLVTLGMIGMAYHAGRDGDLQIRRLYGFFGALQIVTAIVAAWYGHVNASSYAILGSCALALTALVFVISFVRHEDEEAWKQIGLGTLGVVGVLAALAGLVGGTVSSVFFQSYGLVLSLIGLFYLAAFTACLEESSDLRLRAGRAISWTGALVAAIALVRSLLPWLYSIGWLKFRTAPDYFAAAGALLIGMGVLYMTVAAALVSDRAAIVVMRRELSSFFFSPVIYIVLLVFTVLDWFQYLFFLAPFKAQRDFALSEPIVQYFFIALFPVIGLIFAVPVLTMRLLSEEKRTASLEILLTAPVNELPIVLGKFFAALVVFLITWLPYGIYLIDLRLEAGQPFDYRPLISFSIAILFSGAGFMAMGLFFSSLTNSQMISFICTGCGMMAMLLVYFSSSWLPESWAAWAPVLHSFSFIDLWQTSLSGQLPLGYLVFHLTVAVFWLFLTVKVLESRRWA
jgi:ABC-2 type transport system permease protein